MNVGGKLIIQGKAWGEFENAKRSKGNIEISGYRSYGGTHTVRMVDQPQLNENQQKWINRLTINYAWYGETAQHALHATLQEPEMPDLPQNGFAQVLEVFSKWVQEQEEE
ncbi:hypothetical protein HPY92_18060 [Enterococcus gallinarum]|nr:hypothetical protein [Enterococcus gallinarum]ROZ02587.1 hypothetical protein EGX16_16715 [Enterococcus gallinarum]ROZ09084.1 hypothetical protein EGX22_16730 [Enterococcus gallinarum]